MMIRSWWLLSAVVLLAASGCTKAPVEHTVRKVPAEDVRRDADKAVDTATAAAVQAKEDFEMRFKASLAEMEVEIGKLHDKGLAMKDEASARWNEKMANLKAKQAAAREKLDELRTSTGEAWGHVEKGAQSAWDDVRKAFDEAAKEF
jgi:hypothetical protein